MNHLLRDHRDRALEWLSSIAMATWAMILALPGDTIATPNFQEFLAQGLSEDILAWLFGAVGSFRLTVLIINGKWPKTPFLRIMGAASGFVMWSQVAGLFGVGFWFYGTAGTGFAIYSILALAEVFSIAWAAWDARYYQRS